MSAIAKMIDRIKENKEATTSSQTLTYLRNYLNQLSPGDEFTMAELDLSREEAYYLLSFGVVESVLEILYSSKETGEKFEDFNDYQKVVKNVPMGQLELIYRRR